MDKIVQEAQLPQRNSASAAHMDGGGLRQWRSYRGFRRFNEPGPPSQATKKLNNKIIGILLKKTSLIVVLTAEM